MGAGEEDEDYLSEEGSPVIPPPVRQISRFSNMDDDETKGDENEYRYLCSNKCILGTLCFVFVSVTYFGCTSL